MSLQKKRIEIYIASKRDRTGGKAAILNDLLLRRKVIKPKGERLFTFRLEEKHM